MKQPPKTDDRLRPQIRLNSEDAILMTRLRQKLGVGPSGILRMGIHMLAVKEGLKEGLKL